MKNSIDDHRWSTFFLSFIAAGLTLGLDAQIGQASAPAGAEIKNLSVKVGASALIQTSHTTVIAKTSNHPDEPPYMNGEPEHILVTFDGDKFKDFDSALHRQLLIYPLPS